MKRMIIVTGLVLLAINLTAVNTIVFYHNNYGMISETINIPLEKGLTVFDYQELPASIDENTVMLIPSGKNNFTVQTQSYSKPTDRYSLEFVTHNKPNRLLVYFQENIGQDVDVVLNDGSLIKGNMFYYDYNIVGLTDNVNDKNLFVRQNEIRNFIMEPLDFNFNPIPYLSWTIRTDKKGDYQATLTYLCTGFNWEGLYKGVWNGDTLNLEIFAKIINNSGKDIEDYRILLIAGEPKRATPPSRGYSKDRMMYAASSNVETMDLSTSEFTAETFDEYHLFSYSEPVSIDDQQNKQIGLYETKTLKPSVHYKYQTGTNFINTILTINNDLKNNLGVVLPRGKVQLYREEGQEKMLTFIGEDYVNQTPIDEEWVISPGRAFDVVGKTTIMETRNPARNITERDMTVNIKNQSDRIRSIEVVHNIRGNWTIVRNSINYERKDASTIIFKKELKAKEELTITWTERIER